MPREKPRASSHVICGKATDRHEPDLLPSALRRLEARWIRCMSARQVLKGDARWLWTTNHHALALDNQGCHIRHLRMRPESAGRSRPQSASVIARPGSGRDSPVRRGREIPTHPFGQSEENSTFKPKKREAWKGKMPSATRATAERIISEKTAAGDAASAGGNYPAAVVSYSAALKMRM